MQLNTSSDKEMADATATVPKEKRKYKTVAYQVKAKSNDQTYRNVSVAQH